MDLFSSIRKKYGDAIEFYAMTVVELIYIARLSKLSLSSALAMFKDAGVRWITGGGAEILADSFRQRHSPLKYTVAEYMDAQREILAAGLNTTATMVIGFDESFEERMEHLDAVRVGKMAGDDLRDPEASRLRQLGREREHEFPSERGILLQL